MPVIRDLQDPGCRSVIDRHAAYWRQDPDDTPLLKFSPPAVRPTLADLPPSRPYTLPELIEAKPFGSGLERRYAADGLLDDDIIRMVDTGITSEVLVGCPVVIEAGSHWAKPCFTDWHQLDGFRVQDSIWYRRLMENTQRAVDAVADDTYPFCCGVFRGAADMAMAMMTADRLCMEVIDHPRELAALLARITDIVIDTTMAHADLLPLYAGGQFNHFGVWTPGRTVLFTVDASWMFSPGCYEEVFLPHDARLAQAFDTPIVHLHSAAHAHFHLWAQISNLGLQCSVDEVRVDEQEVKAIGPDLMELLPRFEQIRQTSSLMIHGFWDPQRIEVALARLPGGGTAIRGQVDDPQRFRRQYLHAGRDKRTQAN